MLLNIRVWQQITGRFNGSRKKTEELSPQNEQNFISDEEKLACKKRRKEKKERVQSLFFSFYTAVFTTLEK